MVRGTPPTRERLLCASGSACRAFDPAPFPPTSSDCSPVIVKHHILCSAPSTCRLPRCPQSTSACFPSSGLKPPDCTAPDAFEGRDQSTACTRPCALLLQLSQQDHRVPHAGPHSGSRYGLNPRVCPALPGAPDTAVGALLPAGTSWSVLRSKPVAVPMASMLNPCFSISCISFTSLPLKRARYLVLTRVRPTVSPCEEVGNCRSEL
jgi:hypothetical protein